MPMLVINVYFALRNQERSLLNDFAAVLQFCLIVFVSYHIGGGSHFQIAFALFAICFLYFVGTVFYVKTMIRKKNNRKFYILSIFYHILLLLLTMLFYPLYLIIPVIILLMRAIIAPKTGLSVMKSGIFELFNSLLMMISIIMIYS
ncbi:MAG: hypothetical protein A2189_09620 [Paenibacillus sp. RIFOXYA1_FULL_44_5]|nr:MAG: hypothetical protein A2189_09620 [Paenibacillus sp. RIFOXYA1_FULL_44_5]